mgnify:CR=1 FL=1
MFKKISTGFGATALMLGIMIAAGSAGDCDGACMDQANTMGEFIILAVTGVAFMIAGAFFIVVGQSE